MHGHRVVVPVNRNFYSLLPLFIDTVILLACFGLQVVTAHLRSSVLLRDSRIIDVLRLLLATLSWSEECEVAMNARE